MIPVDKITNIYFIVDEFLKEFDKTIKEHSLSESENYKKVTESLQCLKVK